MRARALQQVVQEQRTVIEGLSTPRGPIALKCPAPPPTPRARGFAAAAAAGARGPRRSTPRVRRACHAGGAAEPLAHEPRPVCCVRAAPARVVERHLKLSAHRRGSPTRRRRPARAAGASCSAERLRARPRRRARAPSSPSTSCVRREHRAAASAAIRSAWDVRGGGRGGACQKSLRAARRGHGPLRHHLARAQVRLDAVGEEKSSRPHTSST